jgi:hypothetical protein
VSGTVESYRMALESEISRWNGFAKVLRKADREAFEELMDMCCKNAWAAGNVCNSIIFEPVKTSIVLVPQKKRREFEKQLSAMSIAGKS